ncbi:hypothetical protein [Methylicorpusculum sp.]|uniref:hypothetical protein n=1 Tax=Methylicorpusculum sp. TaxID=2713644 RepID=UPI002731101A|nr:hypothetical protein [Methylicorpusculum sp.]MDP2180221.1 hypothetical protein [Methylicorpusculum sp.]MDP3528229.1 hypothetical protein [Methylicorpusculum sp.]MDZ4150515.1 hypothetical protein [Methylicorpusculum sp.]
MHKPNIKSRPEPPMAVSAEKAAEVFPAVRYFQIHFEYLQEQLQLILRNQEGLQIQQLDSRLLPAGQGVRIDTRAMTTLERLTAGHSTALDSEKYGRKRTGER